MTVWVPDSFVPVRSLVTGASGFLGGHLARRLARSGAPLRLLLRDRAQVERFAQIGAECVVGSLEDPESLRAALRDVVHVYHCAALSSDWGEWHSFHVANVIGVQNLLEAATRSPSVTRLVHVSTTDVYGYPLTPCDEDAPLRDIGLPYNRSKIAGERLVWRRAAAGDLPVTIVRPATIYGPASRDFVVEVAFQLARRQMLLVDGGRCPAGLLYVENAVDALLAAAACPAAVGRAYNLRDETDETWRDFVRALACRLGLRQPWLRLPFAIAYGAAAAIERAHRAARLPGRPLLTRHAVLLLGRSAAFPLDRACGELKFTSRVPFARGVEDSVAWLRGPGRPQLQTRSRRWAR